MAGATPYDAFQNFRRPLQRAIGCVASPSVVFWSQSSDGYTPGLQHVLTFSDGEPVFFKGEKRIGLSSFFWYRAVRAEGERGEWKIRTTAYYHTLEDESRREIIAYHWHPEQPGPIDFPHLHLGAGIGAEMGEVYKAHIPTGRVSLEDVIRLAIRDFGVEPQRDDWREILDETQATFEEWHSRRGSGPNPASI
ncbi:MAG: hypothetical protein ACRDSJ_12420 [Rubrobacteraceae bacterium]